MRVRHRLMIGGAVSLAVLLVSPDGPPPAEAGQIEHEPPPIAPEPDDGLGRPAPSVSTTATTAAVSSCQEDDPCWDCETMGNRICGPVAVEPAPVVAVPTFTG
jgi:hypothetical protein